jgi:hypothetical protein
LAREFEGDSIVKKISVLLALCCSLLCTPASAKTFVGVLWPMFGPLPAIGLVELVGELKMMPDVEVTTYLHQEWPSLVDDLERQPPGTRTVVIGYSLGANASVFVANKVNYIDVVIALQPSMLSWNPAVTGQVGRYIEVYNPNPWMTFGGMGSKKLIGPNIEYVENNDSHPGAQFSSEFRSLVKSEIARVSAEPPVETAQAAPATAKSANASDTIKVAAAKQQPEPAGAHELSKLAAAKQQSEPSSTHGPMKVAAVKRQPDATEARGPTKIAAAKQQPDATEARGPTKLAAAKQQPDATEARGPTKPAAVKEPPANDPAQNMTAFLDGLTTTVDSGSLDTGNLSTQRQLTAADMMDYANRNYGTSHTAEVMPTDYQYR